jgi:cation transport regulator
VPYATTNELPPAARHLPPHAQEIFLSAFNNAWRSYADRGPREQEEIAFRVAWSAVKKQYRRRGETWFPKSAVE